MAKSVFGNELLPPSGSLQVTDLERRDGGWTFRASGPDQERCPGCQQISNSRHSRYVRTLKDLPVLGVPLSLKVRVSRFRCRNLGCAVLFFTSTLPGVAEFRARRTCRADVILRLIGHALGGRPGEHLITRLGLPVSDDTILRRLKKSAQPASDAAKIVGLDEWAWRKGLNYGTIVVDLERRTVIDVLDKHSTQVVEDWLLAHPEIRTICRDRNGRYARAARAGAPKAKQVADRFHLVQNLRETVERELSLRRTHLRVRTQGNVGGEFQLPAPPTSSTVIAPFHTRERMLLPARRLAIDTEIARQQRQTQQNLFDTFKELQTAQLPISEIARQLGLNRRRLDRWATLSELPERKKMVPRPGSVETFTEYLRKRWQDGYRNGRILFDEIRAFGFVGTHKTLDKFLSPWRVGNEAFEASAQSPPSQSSTTVLRPTPPRLDPTKHRQISPQIAAALLTKSRLQLTCRQAEIVDALKSECPGYASMRSLMLGFRSLMRKPKKGSSETFRTVSRLHRWIEQADTSGIVLIQNFAGRLRQDILAVEAAVTEQWSNGVVEGQVNRLKTLKRQMYGRAGVELLRARMIPLAPEPIAVQRE
jgi:transposase